MMFARGVSRGMKMCASTPARAAVGSKRAASIAGARDGELGCSEIFCHGHGHTHSARLETLRWIERFVFDPKIDIVAEFLCAQQRCSAFA